MSRIVAISAGVTLPLLLSELHELDEPTLHFERLESAGVDIIERKDGIQVCWQTKISIYS